MALRTVTLSATFSWNVRPPRRAAARMERALQPKAKAALHDRVPFQGPH